LETKKMYPAKTPMVSGFFAAHHPVTQGSDP